MLMNIDELSLYKRALVRTYNEHEGLSIARPGEPSTRAREEGQHWKHRVQRAVIVTGVQDIVISPGRPTAKEVAQVE